ncbi:MAG: hypothetical protein ACTSWN_13165 [Promethearchaeota archaeon]
MPAQTFDKQDFLEISRRALVCRVKRKPDCVKLKLRTKKRLYTFVTEPETAEVLLKKIKENCDIEEL